MKATLSAYEISWFIQFGGTVAHINRFVFYYFDSMSNAEEFLKADMNL